MYFYIFDQLMEIEVQNDLQNKLQKNIIYIIQ